MFFYLKFNEDSEKCKSSVIGQFNLREGDILDWSLTASNNNLIIVITPEKNKERNCKIFENIKGLINWIYFS